MNRRTHTSAPFRLCVPHVRGDEPKYSLPAERIPSLFTCNEALLVSDGQDARIGTLTANMEWFLPWRTVDGKTIAPKGQAALETMIKGVFDRRWFLD